MRKLRGLSWIVASALLAAPAAWAQEQAQDESAAKRTRLGLQVPDELQQLKRDRAKERGWALTFMSTAAAGFDSNLFNSPDAETDSAFYDFGLKLESLHYFDAQQSLKLSLEGTGSLYPESSSIAEATQKLRAKYSNRLGKRIRLSFAGTVKHANDDEIDINGNEFTRDFENFTYKAKPSIRFRLSKRQALSLAYSGAWSDYEETSGQASLDWWAHGPAAQYRFKLSDAASLRVVYGFTIRNYDENLASLKDGTNLATNPSEKHHYQRVDVKGTWRPVSWLELDGGYRFKIKDDRFEGFESYEEAKWTTGLTLSRFPPWTLHAEAAFTQRDYDNRLGDLATETLEYDKLEGSITASYKVKHGFSFYAHYSYANRDSNRSTGSSYRDYSFHRFLTGFSFAR
ncbi:MAG: hypothetical protein E2O71_11040 [Deltaproteobacteria bacterium]|nr:MAG: hypothetical protein E2O71_11040 [Deltaproteobacteria bacterium]